jgi:hypothetical protein
MKNTLRKRGGKKTVKRVKARKTAKRNLGKRKTVRKMKKCGGRPLRTAALAAAEKTTRMARDEADVSEGEKDPDAEDMEEQESQEEIMPLVSVFGNQGTREATQKQTDEDIKAAKLIIAQSALTNKPLSDEDNDKIGAALTNGPTYGHPNPFFEYRYYTGPEVASNTLGLGGWFDTRATVQWDPLQKKVPDYVREDFVTTGKIDPTRWAGK